MSLHKLSWALFKQWGESPPKESPLKDSFTKHDGPGQRPGVVQDARGQDERRAQRQKISQGVQYGESLLRAETCLDKMTICQMIASGPVRISPAP